MRRIIEELVEKRKKAQQKLKTSLAELGTLLGKKRFSDKSKGELSQKFSELNENITGLITIQDKEWDAYSNNHLTMIQNSLQWKIEKLEADFANIDKVLSNFSNLEKSLDLLIRSIANKTDKGTINQLQGIKEQLSIHSYEDFENRFRGREQEVKENLKQYLPFFKDCDNVLDIGCGRGEFLELLRDEKISSFGIDTSESMLNVAREKQLECKNQDALSWLKEQPDNSLGGIFSAQVIEHFSPDYLRDILNECHRVSKKGSTIVLETINPLSIMALSDIYYLDVSHQKPLHPEYMRYLLEKSGFSDISISYSGDWREKKLEEISPDQEIARIFNANVDKINNTLFAAPVYAVIGSKKIGQITK